MHFKKRSEAVCHENSPTCVAYEYQMPTGELDSAVIEISSRYPGEGWVLNTACTALIFVIKGQGMVIFESGNMRISEDHQVQIDPGEKYALTGDMKLLFTSSPPWNMEQARHIAE